MPSMVYKCGRIALDIYFSMVIGSVTPQERQRRTTGFGYYLIEGAAVVRRSPTRQRRTELLKY